MTALGHAHFQFLVEKGSKFFLKCDFLGYGFQQLGISYAVRWTFIVPTKRSVAFQIIGVDALKWEKMTFFATNSATPITPSVMKLTDVFQVCAQMAK